MVRQWIPYLSTHRCPYNIKNITEFNDKKEPSKEFLRFGEQYLTNNKSDKFHNNTVSLNNCMTRLLGSINSKNNEQVRIIKKWDGLRPNIKSMIGSFHAYIKSQQMKRNPNYVKLGNMVWLTTVILTL